MCLKLNTYLRASLNLARRHHDCVSDKISKTDCLLDPVHIVYSTVRQVKSEDLSHLGWIDPWQEEIIPSTFSTATKTHTDAVQ